MNDFTKEELLQLQEASYYWHEGIETVLTDKLQSMIDNYCDHDGEIGKDYPAEKCMKCRRMWE